MDGFFIPKKFEIQFKRTSDDQYTGALVVDGMQMVVGAPKTLDEITAFLLPQQEIATLVSSRITPAVASN